ncbi:MAG: glycosyltransferase [Arthrospira sp. SH-MAG29]|nr:glycosyltransferase [Arthrospira sp. SH-MAG29]MBS0015514.1 glycosyltransferase [Arthrospira sp. SH-MAG29]
MSDQIVTTALGEKRTLWDSVVKASRSLNFMGYSEFGSQDELDAILLAYGPVARQNVFQSLLYSRGLANGFATLPVHSFSNFDRVPWQGKMVCHFHWPHLVVANCSSQEEANREVQSFRETLCQLKDQGRNILWTVHNTLPHVSRFLEADIEVCQILASEADIIHIMASKTLELTAPYYNIDPNKVIQVPHPSYYNAQPDWVDRNEARLELGLEPDQFVFLVFGAILPYKGYREMIEAFTQLRREGRKATLLIAGPPSDADLVGELKSWAVGRRDVLIHAKKIANENLQFYFRASDVLVCPYTRTLNSGALMMGLSFALPVIAPNVGAFADLASTGCCRLYDPQQDGQLQICLKNILDSNIPEMQKFANQVSQKTKSDIISNLFFSKIRARLLK